MALLEWKDSYRTGIGSIDYEHENLISAINALYGEAEGSADDQKLSRAIGEIHALIEAHFALEEKIMRDQKYPAYTEHKRDHDRLLDEILDIMDVVETDKGAAASLGDNLHTWFGTHFSTLDRDLHKLM
ncbi:MAG: hemerythrin family protein [Rhodospirillaceae bacterium]|nr:hemerythrin family protein [Rhodospirillaceae bacterium]